MLRRGLHPYAIAAFLLAITRAGPAAARFASLPLLLLRQQRTANDSSPDSDRSEQTDARIPFSF